MEFKIFQANVCGLPSNGVWSQAFSFSNFFGVVTIYGEGEIGLRGKEAILRLEEMEVEKMEDFVEKMEKLRKDFLEKEIKVVLTGGYLKGKVLYLVTNGGRIFLKREGRTGVILVKKPGEEFNSGSGYIQEGDMVVFTSWVFGEVVGEEKLKEALGNNLSNFREVLMAVIGGSRKGAEAVGIGVKFFLEEEIEEEEEKKSKGRELMEKGLRRIKKWRLRGKRMFLGRKEVEGYKIVVGEKRKKTVYTLILIVGLLLTGSVFFSLRKQKAGENEKYREVLRRVETTYEEGKVLIDLNPVRARRLLGEAKEDLIKLGKEVDSKWEGRKREELLEKIEEGIKEVGGVNKVEPEFFLDLDLFKKGIKMDKVLSYGERLIIWDKANGSIVGVGKKNKEAEIIGGGKEVKGGKSLAFHGARFYILTDKGIYEGEEGRGKIERVIRRDDDWEAEEMIFAYGGNLYLLDREGEIWKYVRLDEGFSEKQSYLAEGVRVNFENAVKMMIDGWIWVATEKGEIFKFLRGNRENFSFSGYEGKIDKISDFYTDENLDNLYILVGNRVLVFDKKGRLEKEYELEGEGGFLRVGADEEMGRIFLLSRTKIYTVKMKK